MHNPRPTLRPTQPDRLRSEKSHVSPFEGRGRNREAARRAHHRINPDRDAFLRRWSLLMISSFSSREICAVHFDVTFQTACNWFDGNCSPYGHHVDHAVRTLPRYVEIMAGK